jgi:hypothetical protein
MGPTAAVRIVDPVTIDHFVIPVFEEREVELAVESLAQRLGEFFRFLVVIRAHREDLHFLFLLFRQNAFQLPELFETEGSPVASIENQHNRLLVAKVRERDSFSIRVLEREIGSGLSDFDPV